MSGMVLVTVGSTQFDKLVAAASSPSIQHLLASLGYSHLTIQHGKSPISSTTTSTTDSTSRETGLQVTTYTYKSSLREDMEQADLIISHAGKSKSTPLPYCWRLEVNVRLANFALICKQICRLWIDFGSLAVEQKVGRGSERGSDG